MLLRLLLEEHASDLFGLQGYPLSGGCLGASPFPSTSQFQSIKGAVDKTVVGTRWTTSLASSPTTWEILPESSP